MAEENNLQVLSALFLSKEFREKMDTNIDSAIAEAKFNPDAEFVEKLKKYRETKLFADIECSSVRDVHSALETDVGLESRW